MSFILNTSIIITNNKFYKSLRFQNIRKQRIKQKQNSDDIQTNDKAYFY